MSKHRKNPIIINNNPKEHYIDASHQILGRIATYAAKEALNGNRVIVLNAERAVISGTRPRVVARAKLKLKTRTLGNQEKAPTHPRRPDTYVRRTIRGMLPWKKTSGREAFRRVHVYIGTPEEYQSKEIMKIEGADASRLRVPYVTIAQLSSEIGGYTA